MNITVKVITVKSPFSNDLAERHNFIMADIMHKHLKNHSLDLILPYPGV